LEDPDVDGRIILRRIFSKWVVGGLDWNELDQDRDMRRAIVRRPEGKRPLGRHRRRWEDNIKMDLQEVGCGRHGLDWAGSG